MGLRRLLSQYNICCTSILMLYMLGFPKLRCPVPTWKPDVTVYICNPNIGEQRQKGPRDSPASHIAHWWAPGSVSDLVSKYKVESNRRRHLTSVSGLYTFMYGYMHLCKNMYTHVHTTHMNALKCAFYVKGPINQFSSKWISSVILHFVWCFLPFL